MRSNIKILDLFSGIGGFSLGLESTGGFETVAFCEIEKYPQEVLKKNFPGVPIYEDIKTLTAERLVRDGIDRIDVITGGYPCQPFSVAGKQKGEKDDRHLWPSMLEIIAQVRPAWVICENVTGHIALGLDQVLLDLETEGYSSRTFIVPACSVNAPHRRDRLWIVAHSESQRIQGHWASGKQEPHPYEEKTLSLCGSKRPAAAHWEIEPGVGRVADGIPGRVARLKALGNAVVPQICMMIGQAILEFENEDKN